MEMGEAIWFIGDAAFGFVCTTFVYARLAKKLSNDYREMADNMNALLTRSRERNKALVKEREHERRREG